jgi:diguanylate cyclase (GGDEF)-like protein
MWGSMSRSERRFPWGLPALGQLSVRHWSLWGIPGPLLVSVLTVELTAAVLVALGLPGPAARVDHEIRTAVLICVVAVLHAEISRDIEQVRRRMMVAEFHVNLGSIWFFAGAALLSPAYAGICAGVVYTHLWWRSTGPRAPLYRQVFSTASFVLSAYAASAVMGYARHVGGWLGSGTVDVPVLVIGILVFLTVNTALVAGVIAVSNPQAKVEQMLGDWDENLLEITTLCLGGLVAAAMAINPWLVLFVLPPLLVLHRAVLVRHLEKAASIDGKTGLLNAAAWHTQAERELRRVSRNEGPRAVLVLDLDHFKVVNDTHGHLAGDQVLAAIADALRNEVRDRDLVGRFGGEEFVVLLSGLPGGTEAGVEAVAERIRRRVAELRVEIPTADGPLSIAGISVSVGGAVQPGGHGGDLRALLQIADAALYAAKRAGRNAVRMGQPLPPQQADAQPGVAAEDVTPVADAQ